MNFNKYLGVSHIHNFNIITKDIRQHYNINGDPSAYSCNLELVSYNTDNKHFNNRHKLSRLIQKKYRIGYSGFVFKAIIKNKNSKYYTNIFVKEIPIYPADINYNIFNGRIGLSNDEYKLHYYKYNTNSSANIEIFVSYVCSRMFELNVSPAFCLMYGYYNINLKYFIYEVDSDIVNLNPNNTVYRSTDATILEKKNCPIYLLALEKLDFDMNTFKELCNLDLDFFKSIFFQLYSAIFVMFSRFGIKHNDLHVGNIMFKITNKKYIYYKLGETRYKVPTYGFIIKIIDWGRAVYKFNSFEGKNSIFNKNTECENQIIFTRINKNLYRNYRWSDIVIITHNLLYNFPELKQYRKFYSFLKNQIKTTNGIFISTKLFNWETYENISKNKFNIKPFDIINDHEFSGFITKEKDITETIFNILL